MDEFSINRSGPECPRNLPIRVDVRLESVFDMLTIIFWFGIILFYNRRTFGFCGGGCGGDFGSESTSALISSFLIGFVSGTSSFFISFLYFFFFFSFCQRLSVCVGVLLRRYKPETR